MYGFMVLVVSLLSTLTSATDSQLTVVAELEALKDDHGVAQCAMSPPNMTVTARSKIDCMRVCVSQRCSCKCGANYHSANRTCQLHSELPDTVQQQSDCIYYQVTLYLFCTMQTSASIEGSREM